MDRDDQANSSDSSVSYLCVDPGEEVGWASFRDGIPLSGGQVRIWSDFLDWLNEQTPDLWVVEDYIIRPPHVNRGWSHQWDKGLSLRVIGCIVNRAYVTQVPMILQSTNDRDIGRQMLGDLKKVHEWRHFMDAIAHGIYYWHTRRAKARKKRAP